MPSRNSSAAAASCLVDLGQREPDVDQHPLARFWQVVGQQADVDHPANAADIHSGQIRLVGQELDHLTRYAKTHLTDLLPIPPISRCRSEHGLDRLVDGGGDRFAQADAVVDAGSGSQPTISTVLTPAAERVEHAEHHVRLHAVTVEERRGLQACPSASLPVRFDHIDRTRLASARHGIDQDRGVHAVGQVIGQMHAADAVVGRP